tara:strand:+ start:34842 stop:35018 length:177 start_codon:yes stop_codon:yes gene_type:complete
LAFFSENALAYIDPSIRGYLIQGAVFLFGTILYVAKLLIQKTKNIRKNKSELNNDESI